MAAVSGKTNAATSSCVAHNIAKKALTSTEITAYSVGWTSGTTYTRSVSTGVGSETVTLTYTPYSNVIGEYTYATSSGSGKYTLSQSNNNYSISSAGKLTITGATITGSVTISGTTTWGQTLTANPSCSVPSSGCTFDTYQWKADGSNISGATSSTYVLPKEMVGKKISVSVVAHATNYTDKTLTSSQTSAIAKQDLSVTKTNYNSAYDGSDHGLKVKVTSADWTGGTIQSGTSTSYGENLANAVYNTEYTLNPTYTNYTTSKTIYFKVPGGTYYNDYTGSGTVAISKKALTSTQITAYSVTWASGTTYTRSVSTGVGSETVSLTYTPYTNAVGEYTYATSNASGKFILSQSNTNYSISSAGKLTITMATCNPPTGVTIGTDGKVTWTASSNASSYEISIDNSTFTAASSGVDYKSTITASTGSKTVYVRSVCDSTHYTTPSANATATTTVYSVTLTKGKGIASVSGAGNYITGATVSIDATMTSNWTWVN